MEGYRFKGNDESFTMNNPESTSYLYFPMANEAGVMSSITPDLSGDMKTDQNTFLMEPVSSENLHNNKSSRNIWLKINETELWSATGKSALQQADIFTKEKENTILEADFMVQKLTREEKGKRWKVEITSFVPSEKLPFECLHIQITNTGNENLSVQPVIAIPFYGRSADNIRDHRHVTSLLNRIRTTEKGIILNPTLTFDERGHKKNEIQYGIFASGDTQDPVGFFPTVHEFIGEGGNLENPEALYRDKLELKPAGIEMEGEEAIAGIAFGKKEMLPGDISTIYAILVIEKNDINMEAYAEKYLNKEMFQKLQDETKKYWREKTNVTVRTGDDLFNHWMRWVAFQPMLRRIYGCSFLPHHDYGKGGRGWRDLWQDCLALLIMNPDGVRKMLIDNYCGVRIDGTNATIIGKKQGEFIADRNNITRVWMDHGVWPFMTTALYIEQTGDLEIMLEKIPYFKDLQAGRGELQDKKWTQEQGQFVKTAQGEIYKGSILEHILLEHLSAIYDVGEHNQIRLRGADWNDALDLAKEKGESVAFTAMYAGNIEKLAGYIRKLADRGHKTVFLCDEMIPLILNRNFFDIAEKRKYLNQYFEKVQHVVSGKQVSMEIGELATLLEEKSEWIKQHIRRSEWIQNVKGYSWFNSYYDNHAKKVEGEYDGKIRMMLTGQVFTIMSETATEEQVLEISKAADKYLYDASIGGYKLNTDFHEIKMDMGRMFGFAYGHKENGAVFSHMAVMYANALYQRGFIKQGYQALHTLFKQCSDFAHCRIYPGVPEYINPQGRGLYHYLTGAGSWYLLTVVNQMYGVKGNMGNLCFEPKLMKEQFDRKGEAEIQLSFAGRKLEIIYRNIKNKEAEEYKVSEICLDGKIYKECISKEKIEQLSEDAVHRVEVILE